MISVIISLYNKEEQIVNTVHSVLQQTFQDFEIIIVDDGSTDHSVMEVKKINDACIRIVHQQNAGVSVARNRGIEEARYELVAFLDADDEWDREHLDRIYHLYLSYPKADVFATSYRLKDEYGKINNIKLNKICFEGATGILDNYFEVAVCSSPPLWTSAVAMKKNVVKGNKLFPEGVNSGEDLLAWAKLAFNYCIAYDRIPSATYHILRFSSKGNEPKDLQTVNDVVGSSLEVLYQKTVTVPLRTNIGNYISFWYKMRASVNLDLSHRVPAIRCAIKALKYNPKNWKVYSFFLLVCLPQFMVSNIIDKFRKL